MKKYIETLKKCPLFDDINETEMERMLSCMGTKTFSYSKKETVLNEGDPADLIGIVLSGEIQTVQIDYYGNRSILDTVFEGEMFNEAFACAKTSSIPVSFVANKPSVVMLIDCEHILHTCENNCSFHRSMIYNIMKDLALKTISYHQRVEITSKRTTRAKLLAFLDIMAKKTQKRNFEIPFDRQELADYLEVERSGLSTEIGKLRREGIIDCEKNKFTLL